MVASKQDTAISHLNSSAHFHLGVQSVTSTAAQSRLFLTCNRVVDAQQVAGLFHRCVSMTPDLCKTSMSLKTGNGNRSTYKNLFNVAERF